MEQEREEWRPVVGYEGRYEVSSLGRVRCSRTGHILKQQQANKGNGSYKVKIYLAGRQRNHTITRLVAGAFLGEPPQKGMNVYHKDNDAANNRPDNLYWDKKHPTKEAIEKGMTWRKTEEGRAVYRRTLQKRFQDPGQRVSFDRSRKVVCVETGVIYPSQTEAAKAFGLSPHTVSSSCRNYDTRTRRIWQVSDKPVFHFRYYNPEDYKPKERIWKPVVGFEGKYEVSNLGEVRHTTFKKILKARLGNMGCWLVGLSTEKGSRHYLISRLVANAFLSKVYGAYHVAHRDGDSSNNCVTNLFWTTPNNAEFTRYRISKNKYKRPVICVETGVCYPSMKEAAQVCCIDIRNVFICCKREKTRQNTHRTWRGKPILHFRYADQ